MVKRVLSLLLIFSFVFFNFIFAGTIVLKSGKTIEGKITQRTDEYVKISVEGIPVKYYLDEIETIQGDNQIESNAIEESLSHKLSPSESYFLLQEAVTKGDLEEIKKYLTKDMIKQIEGSEGLEEKLAILERIAPENIEIISEDVKGDKATLLARGLISGMKAKGLIKLIHKQQKWLIEKEDWKTVGSKNTSSQTDAVDRKNKGKGEIKGYVKLPDSDKQGDLFVFFVPKGTVVQGPDSIKPYVVIDKKDIDSKKVPFSISQVPAGDYWGFATWDIAEPFWEPSWGEGNCPGYAGDYAGGTKEKIVVSSGEVVQTVINCTRYLKPINPDDYSKEYKVLDLQYRKGPIDNKPQLIVNIKNTGDKPLQEINLKVNINGKKEYYFVSGAGGILEPGKEKEFDIFTSYNGFVFAVKKGFYQTDSLYDLDIEISSDDNDNVFTKHISIKDLKAEMNPQTLEITYK